jgi:predicted DNA-binding transcriptional regulator AlpA
MKRSTLLTSSETAQRLNISAATVRGWRRSKLGPLFIRLGPRKCVRYRTSDIEAFLQNRMEDSNVK